MQHQKRKVLIRNLQNNIQTLIHVSQMPQHSRYRKDIRSSYVSNSVKSTTFSLKGLESVLDIFAYAFAELWAPICL